MAGETVDIYVYITETKDLQKISSLLCVAYSDSAYCFIFLVLVATMIHSQFHDEWFSDPLLGSGLQFGKQCPPSTLWPHHDSSFQEAGELW